MGDIGDPRLVEFAMNCFVAGVYVFVGAYHIQIFSRRPEQKTYLWLALVCFAALSVDITGIMIALAPQPPPRGWVNLINGVSVVAASAFLLEFVEALRGRRASRLFRGLALSGVLLTILSQYVPTIEFSGLLISAVILATGMAKSARAAFRNEPEARIVGAGYMVLGTLLLADLAINLHLIPDMYGLPVAGFAVLFLAMAVSLSTRFERAHRELDTLRVDLERRVAERTEALGRANRRLRRYFPASVVDRILNSAEEQLPVTERREITVLFSDLSGFTSFSDRNDPQVVTGLLNEYMSAMLVEIEVHGGTLDKVMGDGLMAIWGAPGEMPPAEQARRAVAAAVAMQERLCDLGEAWTARGLRAFRARIGIHQDVVSVGNIGAADLWSYTAVGSGVNLASRLEGAASPGGILVSDVVHRPIAGDWSFLGPRTISLKGIDAPVTAWELLPEARRT